MPIQYAGVDLLLEDPEGKVCRWIDRYLSTDGMQFFGPLTAWVGSRSNPRSNVEQFTAFPIPNYPDPPKLKINTLYWPTGASRWSVGLFLADDAKLTEILSNLNADSLDMRGNAALLRIWDTDGPPSDVNGMWMYLLPPRKVSAYDGSGTAGYPKNGVWILPLVDERYWWQFKRFSGEVSSWDNLLESIRDTVSSFSDWAMDGVPSEYGRPHSVEFNREDDSVAMVLDAAAHCVGMRFVMDTHSTAYPATRRQTGLLRNPVSAESILNSNIHGFLSNYGILAGGEFSNNHISMAKPEKVLVVFPRGRKDRIGDTKEADLGGAVSDTYKVFHEAADTEITDDTWRQDLANRIAQDFKGWCSRLYDVTYPGIVDWRPCGFDNWIEFSVGKRLKGNIYKMQTRVCSMPLNFGVENLCHQQDPTPDDPDDDGNSSDGCCASCIDRRYMSVFGNFSHRYYVRFLPDSLKPTDQAGEDLLLEYVGLSDGLPDITDDFPYWESDTFEWDCSKCRPRSNGACRCDPDVEFEFDLPTDPATPVTLTFESGCIWSASGADWTASFNISTGRLELSWDGGACTAIYELDDDEDLTGDIAMNLVSDAGGCAPPATITMTGPDSTVETYFWRLVIGASAPCRTGGGVHDGNAQLYLVHEGSGSTCLLDEWNCDGVTGPTRQYWNHQEFRGRCGTKFGIHYPNALQKELEAVLACEVCVYPRLNFVGIPCEEQLSDIHPGPWPDMLLAEIVSMDSAVASALPFLAVGPIDPLVWGTTNIGGSTGSAYITYGDPGDTTQNPIIREKLGLCFSPCGIAGCGPAPKHFGGYVFDDNGDVNEHLQTGPVLGFFCGSSAEIDDTKFGPTVDFLQTFYVVNLGGAIGEITLRIREAT